MWDSSHIWRKMIIASQGNGGGKKSHRRQGNGHKERKNKEERAKWPVIWYHLLENRTYQEAYLY